MRIMLSSIARGHMYSLAAQLAKEGHLARLYCAYPGFKMRREDVPPERISSFPWIHSAYMAAKRYRLLSDITERVVLRLDATTYEDFVARNLVEADVFHGLSGHNLKPGLLAKQRGAKYVCDRGSSHIEYQSRILSEEGDRVGINVKPVDSGVIDKELAEYAACDRIFLPSMFARRTFIERQFSPEKIWSAPYGVDLSRWHPVPVTDDGVFRVVYLGALSMRKGIHDLLEAFRQTGLQKAELVLIGGMVAESERLLKGYRGMPNLVLTGRLSHNDVLSWFSRSSVFVLPSIEDGFGLVLTEAQACGLPVIATCNTGGPDIVQEGLNGFIVPIRSPGALAEKLVYLHSNPAALRHMRDMSLASAQQVKGWQTFARGMLSRYESLFRPAPTVDMLNS